MNKVLSPQSILAALVVFCAVVAGVRPALLPHGLMVLGTLYIFADRGARGAFAMPSRTLLVLLGGVLAIAAASVQWTLLPARAMYDLLLLLVLAALALFLPPTLENKNSEQLLKLFITAFVVAIIIFVMDVAFNMMWQRALFGKPWDVHMPLASLNRASFCVVLLLWPLLGYCVMHGWRGLAAALWLVAGIALAASESNAAHLAFAIGTIVFAVAYIARRGIHALMGVGLLAALILTFPLAQYATDLWAQYGAKQLTSFGHRTEIWQFTAEHIAEKPMWGWGLDASRAIPNGDAVSMYQDMDPMKKIIPMHPHNWVLQALLELGAAGLAAMGALWAWLLLSLRQLHASVQPAALAVYATAMVVAMVSIGLWQIWWLAALLFASMLLKVLHHEAYRTGQ